MIETLCLRFMRVCTYLSLSVLTSLYANKLLDNNLALTGVQNFLEIPKILKCSYKLKTLGQGQVKG